MASRRPWYGEFLVAGTSAVGAICITNPIDVVKTRMTLQGEAGGATKFRDPISALLQIGRSEGIAGLQRGLGPSCLWQFSNVSVRFGVYSNAKTMVVSENSSPLRKWLHSLGLAAISGGFAALASNPFFILKTRFQSGGQHELHAGLGGAVASIWRADGAAGFLRGLSAFAPRVIVASAVQLSTYDAVKEWLQRRVGVRDGIPLVTASSFVTGAAVVLAMQPFDFAATRLVNSKSAGELGVSAAYTGPFDVIVKTLRAEGILGLYRGGTANYLRFGPYCVLVFIFVEQGRKLETKLLDWRARRRDLQRDAEIIRITNAGFRESHVHDVTITKEAPNYRVE